LKNANVIVFMLKFAYFRYGYWLDKEWESFINVLFRQKSIRHASNCQNTIFAEKP